MNILFVVSCCILTGSIYGKLDGPHRDLKINTNKWDRIRIHGNIVRRKLVDNSDANSNNNKKPSTFHVANPVELNGGILNSNTGSTLTIPIILNADAADDIMTTTTTTTSDTTTTSSDTKAPETTTTEAKAPETTTTEAKAPDTTTTETKAPDTTTTDTKATDPTVATTSTESSSGAIDTTTSAETSLTFATGEPSPTHSAKLGMGFGITLISITIIAEVIYFKCFYKGGLSRDDYIA